MTWILATVGLSLTEGPEADLLACLTKVQQVEGLAGKC